MTMDPMGRTGRGSAPDPLSTISVANSVQPTFAITVLRFTIVVNVIILPSVLFHDYPWPTACSDTQIK